MIDVDFLAPFKYIELYRFIPQVCPPESHNWLEHDSISRVVNWTCRHEKCCASRAHFCFVNPFEYWCLSPRVAVGISLICLASVFIEVLSARHWEGTRTAMEWSMEGRPPCELSGSALERLPHTHRHPLDEKIQKELAPVSSRINAYTVEMLLCRLRLPICATWQSHWQ